MTDFLDRWAKESKANADLVAKERILTEAMEAVWREPRYFTLPQLAERWQVSVITLRRRIKAGTLKHVAIGKLFRIERDEVERIENEMRNQEPMK